MGRFYFVLILLQMSSSNPKRILPSSVTIPSSLFSSDVVAAAAAAAGNAAANRTKKLKLCQNDRGVEWLARQIPVPKELTLMDHCAKFIANRCETPVELFEHLDKYASKEYSISDLMKIKIGLFLKGILLDTLIQSERGLATLSVNCVSQCFEPFLVHVLNEGSRIGRTIPCFDRHRQAYATFIKRKTQVDHNVHRLGLTESFRQTNLNESSLDYLIDAYYGFLNGLQTYRTGYLPMVEPIPKVLRINESHKELESMEEDNRFNFPLGPVAALKQLEMIQSSSKQVQLIEQRGQTLSPYSSKLQHRKLKALLSFSSGMSSEDMSTRAFFHLLSAMARCHHNNAPHLVFYMCLLALTEPFYCPKYNPNTTAYNQRRLQFKFDVFLFFATALSSLNAKLDLPLACLLKAKRMVSSGVESLLSDEMRYAVAYQTILVDYGHWHHATTLFHHWYAKIPCSSQLFRDLILVHIKGVFFQIENVLAELWITKIYHTHCTKRCYEEYIETTTKNIGKRIDEAKAIAHACLSLPDLYQIDFNSELELILDVCNIYHLSLEQTHFRSDAPYQFSDRLGNLWQKMQWQCPRQTVRHLQPFVQQLPFSTTSAYFWNLNMDQIMIEFRERQSKVTHVVTSRVLADCLFSTSLCMLYHSSLNDKTITAFTEALEEYERFTMGRHYRIPLIRLLLQVLKESHVFALPQDLFSCLHPKIPAREKNAIGMTLETVFQFASSLEDVVNHGHETSSLNNESFIDFLKRNDKHMTYWIMMGQQIFTFVIDL